MDRMRGNASQRSYFCTVSTRKRMRMMNCNIEGAPIRLCSPRHPHIAGPRGPMPGGAFGAKPNAVADGDRGMSSPPTGPPGAALGGMPT